jgi:hypothetical protein
MSLHRARARKNVRLAQISALGLVALAGLLAAMPAPSAPIKADPLDKAGDPTDPAVETPVATDLSDLTSVFDMALKSQPVEAPKVEEEQVVNTEEPKKDEDIGVGPPHFRYIGLVSSPRRTYALIIDHEDKCQWVAPGEYIGEYSLLAVSSEKLILTDCHDETRHEYTIEARPEVAPADTLLEVATKQAPPQQQTPYNPANINASEMHINGINEQMERERADRMKEIEEKRKQFTNKNPQTPPNRTAPASPQPKPTSPQNKNANNKEPVK